MTAPQHPDPTRDGCVADAGRGRPRARGLVCAEHARQLARVLDPDEHGQMFTTPGEVRVAASIPVLFARLDAAPVVGEKLPGGAFASTPPGRLVVMAHRDPRSQPDDHGGPWSALGTLAAIAARFDERDVDNRAVALPSPDGDPAAVVLAYATWLYRRLDALCAAPWVADAWHDLDTLHRQLRRAAGDPPPVPVGSCRALIAAEGAEDPEESVPCRTPLFAPERAPQGEDEPVTIPRVKCSRCGKVYDPAELVRNGVPERAA